jgi:hypothetical protein
MGEKDGERSRRKKTATVNGDDGERRRHRSPSSFAVVYFFLFRSFAVFFSTSSDGDGETTAMGEKDGERMKKKKMHDGERRR